MLAKAFKKHQDWAPLLLRLILGIVFLYHGFPKLMDFAGTVGLVKSIQFPLPEFFAFLLILAEVGGGLLLLAGLFTRYVSITLAFDMVVAILAVHLKNGFGKGGFEFPLVLFVMCFVLIILGSGKFSLEKALFKKEL